MKFIVLFNDDYVRCFDMPRELGSIALSKAMTPQGAPLRGAPKRLSKVRISDCPTISYPLSLYSAAITKKGTKERPHPLAGKEFFISQEANSALSEVTYFSLDRALTDEWGMENIRHTFNCLCLEWQGRDYPLVLSWTELGRLAKEFKVEMADLAGTFLRIGKRNQLQLSNRKKRNYLSNEQIREQLRAYFRRQDQRIPPPLFVEINEQGEISLGKNDQGEEVLLKVYRFGEGFHPFCFARVTALSPSEIEVKVFSRVHHTSIGHTPRKHPVPPSLLVSGKAKAPVPAPNLTGSSLSERRAESGLIADWLLGKRKLQSSEFLRSVSKDGVIRLASVNGESVTITIPSAIREEHLLESVCLVLEEGEVERQPAKIARIYDGSKPEGECLISFHLKVKPDSRVIAIPLPLI